MQTLGAQFAKSIVDRVVQVVNHLDQKGWTTDKIFAKMKAELSVLDEHTLLLLFNKAVGQEMADDITSDNVASERELKPGTIKVVVHKPIENVQLTGLLRYQGKDWYVGVRSENSFVLKRLI